MKKSLLFTVCFVVASLSAYAQSDSLRQEIMTSTSMPVLISNGRQMFLQEILTGNEQKAAEIRDYLNSQVQNTPYFAFTVSEYFMSLYWTRDYDELLMQSVSIDSLLRKHDPKIAPTYDELAMRLPSISADSLQMLETRIEDTMLNFEERDYLRLFLKWLVALHPAAMQNDYEALREISDEARDYLTEHPYTLRKSFIISHLIYDFEENKWAYGTSLGIGPVFLDGRTKHYFNNPCFGLTLVVDVLYRNLYMGLGIFAMPSGLNRDITFRGSYFNSKDHMTMGGIDLRVGYKVLDTSRFTLVPYGAAAFTGISISRKNEEGNTKSKNSFGYGGGAFLDIKFPHRKSAVYQLTGRVYSYTSLRLGYHISSANYAIPGTNRTMTQWFTIEWGGLTRKVNRVGY